MHRGGSAAALAVCVAAAALRGSAVQAKLSWGNDKISQLQSEITSFMVIGDWGGSPAAPYTTPSQLQAAAGLAKIAAAETASFILSPGGNFYDGLPAAADSAASQTRVQDTWNDVYNTPYPVLAALPWYTVAGQVDWKGNVTAEMQLNGTNSGQFMFPDLFYTFQTVVPFSGDTIDFIMIDTMSLIGGNNDMPTILPYLYYPPPAPGPGAPEVDSYMAAGGPGYSPDESDADADAVTGVTTSSLLKKKTTVATTAVPTSYAGSDAGAAGSDGAAGSVRHSRRNRRLQTILNMETLPGLDDNTIEGFAKPAINSAQWNWVENAINSSFADWLIVVGNHPVWSVGPEGPTWLLAEKLSPIMEAAGVALYISGMDHMLEHFKPSPKGANVDYIVVGAGAYFNDTEPWSTLHAEDCPDGALEFQYVDGTGFANIRVNHAYANVPGMLKVTFYDANGDVLYDFYKENPRTVQGHVAGNLGAPPAPTPLNENADSGGPMVIISGIFIVTAVGMGLWIAASHALAQAGYKGTRRGMGPGEHTPLVPDGGLPGVVNL